LFSYNSTRGLSLSLQLVYSRASTWLVHKLHPGTAKIVRWACAVAWLVDLQYPTG